MTAPTIGASGQRHSDIMSWGPNDPPITIEQMMETEKLLTLDQATEVLRTTEPLAFVSFDTGPQLEFRVTDGWNNDIDLKHGTEPVEAFVKIDGNEYQLAKDAVFEATTTCGLGKGYVGRAPGHLTEDALNYWFRTGLENKELQLMVLGDDQLGSAITRGTIRPFSNLRLLETALAAIEARHPGLTVYVDRNKMSHSLRLTHFQLVIPELGRVITDTGEVDDRWWGGVQITNSMIGEKQTDMSGFMFRQRCTNGMIDTAAATGAWSRRSGGQEEDDVMSWARNSVDEILGGLETSFDAVQALVSQPLHGEVGRTAADVFESHRIPVAARRRIQDGLIEEDHLTMYGLTNAITAAANGQVSAGEQQQLMRAGGDLAYHSERCGECRRLMPDGISPTAQAASEA